MTLKKKGKMQLSLIPNSDLEFNSEKQEYTAKGVDPIFIVDLGSKVIPAGWYALDIEILNTRGLLLGSKIYFDYGRGFNEEDSWLLPKINNGRIISLIKFPWDILNLRFDPCFNYCSFKIGKVKIKRINKLTAFAKALHNYKKHQPDNKGYLKILQELSAAFVEAGQLELKKRMKEVVKFSDTDNSRIPYILWHQQFDTITEEDDEKMKEYTKILKKQPRFSIIMPVYNPAPVFLNQAIESVIRQSYTNWELCVADDCSTNPEIKKILSNFEKSDSRIKVVYRQTNGHISVASNSAIDIATGEYLVLLDNDDELSQHALFMVAHSLNHHPDAALIYSDEDKMDENGIRFDPYFKSDWNPELFLGQNMISHLGVYKTDLVKQIGGFRAGFEGSQDYDLALRMIEKIKPSQIIHIPHILYHWRAIEGSTAVTANNKNYAYQAGLKAIQEHLVRSKTKDIVVENTNHSFRIKRHLMFKPTVSILIPSKDKTEVLATCIKSILQKTIYPNFEIVIIDNNSETDEAKKYLKSITQQDNRISVLSYRNAFNFSAMMNYGVKNARGEVLILLNNDTEVINEEWLTELVSNAIRKEVGAVGAKLFYPNNLIQHAGVFLYEGHPGIHIYSKRNFNDHGYFNKLNLTQNYSAVSAACLAIKKELYIRAGGLDEANLAVAYNDVDFCLKLLELGYHNVWTPFAQLYHYESLSRGNDLDEKNITRFKKEHSYMLEKWKKTIANDPYFNHNLSCETLRTGYAYPPKIKYPWRNN